MKTSDFNYDLPPEMIAQEPVTPRDSSRLFVVRQNETEHLHFRDLPQLLEPGDVLVFNDSKVFPARLRGKKETGGKIEALLLEQKNNIWQALLKPGKGTENTTISFGNKLNAKVIGRDKEIFLLEFNKTENEINQLTDKLGVTPTPPYIKNAPDDLGKYQTIYAQERGSVAAPTAGLHFTKSLMKELKEKEVQFEYVTLHVGLGTFQPVKETNVEEHKIHTERYSLKPKIWQRIREAKSKGRRIIAVGTTSCRVLETLGESKPDFSRELSGTTNLFVLPGYQFKMVDALITNFHLPESTLLMLVAAFIGDKIGNSETGINKIKRLYKEAIKKRYRFYSFGDAMFIE